MSTVATQPTQPPGDPLELDPRQRELHAALHRKEPTLASMYAGGLLVMRQGPNPERLVLAAHSFRELMEKLPPSFDVPDPRGPRDLGSEVKNLRAKWDAMMGKTKCREEAVWCGELDGPLRGVLRDLEAFFEW